MLFKGATSLQVGPAPLPALRLPQACGRQCAAEQRSGVRGTLPSSRGRPLLPLPPRRRPAPPWLPPAAAFKQGDGQRWGNENRLGPGQERESSRILAETVEEWNKSLRSVDAPPDDEAPSPPTQWQRLYADQMGRLQYKYFNWRQDTWSDLQLFMTLNVGVFLAGAWIEGAIINGMDDTVAGPPPGAGPLNILWYNLYSVLAVVLGQDLPPAEYAGWPSQMFAIITAIFGLASFALVLALIEQVVLEVLEVNVKRGSPCFEKGHTVILAWCESSSDIGMLTRMLTQLCAANRRHNGGVVVVLGQQRGKLEMESLFRAVIPDRHRFGTRFVFRQGSPLDPAALRMVAAADAQHIIVCGDGSKTSKDADAQVLRACVLLDELIQRERPGGSSGPVVVAEIKTEDALPLVRFACSHRVMPVPTSIINARRYVRLLHQPIAAVFSRCLSDFYSPAHGTIDRVPEVEGLAFKDLGPYFPEALVIGLANRHTGYCQLNPLPDKVVQLDDDLILLRPERDGVGFYRPLLGAVPADVGSWRPEKYVMRSQDEQPLGAGRCGEPSLLAQSARPHGAALGSRRAPNWAVSSTLDPYQACSQGLFLVPVQYSNALAGGELLICGWMGNTFMWELLQELDHSDQALPIGSKVTLFNDHWWQDATLEDRLEQHNITNLMVEQVRGDPRSRADMQRLIDVSRYKAAIVVCDSLWVTDAQPNASPNAGLSMLSQADMLSLDAAVLMVQLNIRLLLEEAEFPGISIICEKLTYVGETRFEDDTRLPLGITVNSASYAAKALTQVAVSPRFLRAYLQLGKESDLVVQDSSAFAEEGEELSFFQLQARAASVRQVLMGYYRIPASAAEPLELVVNPQGLEERSKPRVWNVGDWRCKLVTLVVTKQGRVQEEEQEAQAVADAIDASGYIADAESTGANISASSSGSVGGGSGSGSVASGSEALEWREVVADFDSAAQELMTQHDIKYEKEGTD